MFKVREQVGLHELDVLYEAVAPPGKPEVNNETFCVEPELSVALIVLLTDCPRVTDLSPPLEREKSNVVVVAGVALHASAVYAELPAEL
jgi:hypothetical protein